MITQRLACLLITDFALAVYLRCHPEYHERPLALAGDRSAAELLLQVNACAAAAGVTTEMTVAQGTTVCPELAIGIREEAAERERSIEIRDALQRLSPRVETAEPGSYYLDLRGMRRLYPTDDAFARALIATITPLGFSLQVGIAGSKFVAATAARQAAVGSYLIVPSGGEGRFLAALPVTALPLSDERLETLHALGVTRLGQAAAVPAGEWARRFGYEGDTLAACATGSDRSLLHAAPPDETLAASTYLSESLVAMPAVLWHIEQLLGPLLAQVGRFSQGCSCFEITLALADRTTREYAVAVDRPTLSVKRFLRQMTQQFGTAPLESPVSGVTVRLPAVMPLWLEQQRLHPEVSPGNARFDGALSAELKRALRRPQVWPGILPEERGMLMVYDHTRSREEAASDDTVPPFSKQPVTGLRLVRPPQAIKLVSAGRHPAVLAINQEKYLIRRAEGPWRLSGGWWETPFDRAYYEVETLEASRYLVYREVASARWFLQGIYD